MSPKLQSSEGNLPMEKLCGSGSQPMGSQPLGGLSNDPFEGVV